MIDRIRAARDARGWSQRDLAVRAGVTRQLVSAVEAGRHAPNVDAALGIARALGTSVEALFAPAPDRVEPVLGVPLARGSAVRAASVGDTVVVAPVGHADAAESWPAADGVLGDVGEVAWLPGAAPDGFVVVGCDPLLGLLARLVTERGAHRIVPVHGSSAAAVDALAAGRAHAGVVHGPSGGLPGPPTGLRRWHVARWQVGLASRQRTGPPSVDEIVARGLRIVRRADGAASTGALVRALRAAGADGAVAGPVGSGHLDVARRVSGGGPTAGLTMEPAALAYDLSFAALEQHDVELWIDQRWTSSPAAVALVEALDDPAVRARASLLPGYDLTASGAERRAG